MKKLISVIIPVYNTSSYLRKCLDSVVSQTYSNIEIIVIDDGSSDGSELICDEYEAKDDRVVVMHKGNEGLVNARKSGFKLSHGEYIAFVDSDDWVDINMFESLLKEAEAYSSDVVISAARASGDDISMYIRNIADSGVYTGKKLEEFKDSLFNGESYFSFSVLPFLWNKLWKRSLLEDNLLNMDETITIGEDVAIGFPAIMQSECTVIVEDAYYHYRKYSGSMLSETSDQKKEFENAKRLFCYQRNRLREIGYLHGMENGLERYYIHQLLTRAYEMVNDLTNSLGLFPYFDRMGRSMIIYGAGSFGVAVYKYAVKKTNVKAWVDKNAEFLRKTGYPVITLDEVDIKREDIVVVAVLTDRISEEIKKKLLDRNVNEGNIYLFSISKIQQNVLIKL